MTFLCSIVRPVYPPSVLHVSGYSAVITAFVHSRMSVADQYDDEEEESTNRNFSKALSNSIKNIVLLLLLPFV